MVCCFWCNKCYFSALYSRQKSAIKSDLRKSKIITKSAVQKLSISTSAVLHANGFSRLHSEYRKARSRMCIAQGPKGTLTSDPHHSPTHIKSPRKYLLA